MGGQRDSGAAETAAGVADAFAVDGRPVAVERHGSGHIHETFVARYEGPGGPYRLVLQRLNTGIFSDPDAVMENLLRVTEHLRAKLVAGGADPERRCLSVVSSRAGAPLHRDAQGGVWRALRYVEGTRSCDTIESASQAREAARAFGAFAAALADLPGPRLHDTIAHFHDLGHRFRAFEAALERGPADRRTGAARDIERLRHLADRLESVLPTRVVSGLPRRVVHHDCKLNNVLLDAHSGEALCVIDLDTVMEGTLLSDFGELVRTATCRAPEDEPDLSRVVFDPELFSALAAGYARGAADPLEPAERSAMPWAGSLLTLMNALRFLTDHLEGDVYFRIHREGQNLDRARAQLRLAEHMLEQGDELADRFHRATERG